MGFFSQECSYCHKSILNPYSVIEKNTWMSDAVAITPAGEIYKGTYDGYGSIGSVKDAIGFDNEVYHDFCWTAAGAPTVFTAPSVHSADQGYFFDDDEYDFANPQAAKAGTK